MSSSCLLRALRRIGGGAACGSICVALGATGCAPSAPRLHPPDHVDVYCGDRAAVATAIESIVASNGAVASGIPVPSPARIRTTIAAEGGIIAHWNDQPLYAPAVAKAAGSSDDYVTIGDAAISDRPVHGDSRSMFLTVKTSAGPRTFAVQAFDVQQIYNQGKLSS